MAMAGGIEAGRAFVALYLNKDALTRGLKAAKMDLKAFGDGLKDIGKPMMMAGVGIALGTAVAMRAFLPFDDQMKAVAATTGNTGEAFDRLTEKAKELGRTTSWTATEVAAAMLNLARAGFSMQEIDASIAGILNLARATGTDLALAANIAAGTLRAFGLEASESTRVADVLVATANGSAQTLEDLGESMKYVAPIAEEFGLSLEETSKALGVLANMQIKGSMAGISLRMAMTQLADPAVQKRLRSMGVEVLDLNRNLRTDFGSVFAEIGRALQTLPTGERLSVLKELFDQRAMGAAAKLAKSDFPALTAAIDHAGGVAARTAAIMDSGAGGAIRLLLSAFEGLNIAIGEVLAGPLMAISEELQDWLAASVEWVNQNQGLVITLAQVGAGLIAVGAALFGIGTAATVASTAVGTLSAVLTFLAAHPVVLTLMAVTAATVALGMAMTDASEATTEFATAASDAMAAGDAARAADESQMKRLEQLAAKQRMTSVEMEEATRIIAHLERVYGDLGLTVNAATGAIDGMAGAQDTLNTAMREAAEEQLAAQILENEANQRQILARSQAASENAIQWWVPFIRNRTPGMSSGEAAADRMRQRDLETQHTAMVERLRRLREGDASAATGQGGRPGDAGAPSRFAGQIPTDAEKALRFQRDLEDELSAKRIAAIDNEHRRAIAAIDEEYRLRERDIRENADLTEQQQADALATIRAMEESDRERARAEAMNDWRDIAKKQQEESERTAERQQDLADEIARAEIEATMKPGAERENALLELERRKALVDAAKEGQSLADVNRLYDLKAQAIQSGDTSRIATAGTFSAYQAASFGTGNPQLEIAKNTRENARIAAVSNKRLEGMERTLQRLADNKSVVVID